ncbi:hypothetical protein LCGC14_0632540 [marine sediment metagenome]|uniref:Uncharacterized protein n=1 Tax=marine sediment metagenome TaxID=412755 RepID=A0A0F9R6Q8_9ZZZZ
MKKFRKVVNWSDDPKELGGFFGTWGMLILGTILYPILYIICFRNVHWEEIKERKVGGKRNG